MDSLFGMMTDSKRRSRLGVGVQKLEPGRSGNYRKPESGDLLPDKLLGSKTLQRNQSFEMLRRAKLYLALRSVKDFDSLLSLDYRRVWNKENPGRAVKTLLDLFPSLKHSYESILPLTARLRKRGINPSSADCGVLSYRRAPSGFADSSDCPDFSVLNKLFPHDYIDVVASAKNNRTTVRLADICRSHSIWLDPVDAPKELYKWRLRVQKSICWAYENGCVPVMMTLTIFHRWHCLKGLLKVLRKSWSWFMLTGGSATRRRAAMGLEGYVRRLEITINDGQENRIGDAAEPVTNSGWHPHIHVILFVSKDKFTTVSNMEAQLRKDWVDIVSAQFQREFGEKIDLSYFPAFAEHGLHLSRYTKGKNKGQLRPVQDSVYLDKIEGYDNLHVYGIDKEVSASVIKDSKIPFDLLREVSAANIDLWCEYAISTKNVPALHFARPLIKRIDAYFAAHPDKDPAPADLPSSEVIAHMDTEIYRLFYRNFLIPELKKKASEGYESLSGWVKDKLVEIGVSALYDDPSILPRPPNSIGISD